MKELFIITQEIFILLFIAILTVLHCSLVLRMNKMDLLIKFLLKMLKNMNSDGITKEMAYLCIGDEMDNLGKEQIFYKNFKGIKYFSVGGENVIRGENGIFCSCNQSYCWHIFKLVFDEKKAIRNDTDIRG